MYWLRLTVLCTICCIHIFAYLIMILCVVWPSFPIFLSSWNSGSISAGTAWFLCGIMPMLIITREKIFGFNNRRLSRYIMATFFPLFTTTFLRWSGDGYIVWALAACCLISGQSIIGIEVRRGKTNCTGRMYGEGNCSQDYYYCSFLDFFDFFFFLLLCSDLFYFT